MAFSTDTLSLRQRKPSRHLWHLILILILLAVALPAIVEQTVAPEPVQAQLAWTQIWNEEFNGAGRVDTSKWIYDIGHGYPGGPANWGTGEIAYHTDSTANVNQSGGSLAITPRRDGAGNWTSGRIETVRTDFAAPAGGALAVEGRIQHPNVGGAAAQGYWPAFWMLGEGYRADRWSWPRIGEIDLLETVNGQDMVISTLHCGTTPGGPCNETSGISSGPKPCVGCRTSFHNYRMEYDRSRSPEQLRFYLDGGLYHTINQGQAPADVWSNALHHGFHIILNVAMGGGWPGNPTASTQPGAPMLVDWVRVYRATPCAGCPTPTTAPPPTMAPSTPYLGSPVSLPGTIQAENFDRGGAGVAFNETTPGNTGGYNYRTDGANDVDIANNCGVCVNYIAPGEWLRYAVSVANAGSYTFNFRHAGGGGGTFHLETTSGQQLTGPIFQQATASWDTYVTYSQQVNLPAGNYGIILKFDSCPACNLNNVDWFSFSGGPTGPTATRTRTRTNTALGGATTTRTRTRTRTPTGPTATRTRTPTGPTATRTRTRTNTSGTGGTINPYATVQAEIGIQVGTTVQTTSDTGGGQNVTSIANGDYIQFNNVDFGSGSPFQIQSRVASGASSGISGLVEFHIDSVTGPKLGDFAIASTGGWQSWQTVPANSTGVSGVHTLYVVFKSGQPADYVNLNWFYFVR